MAGVQLLHVPYKSNPLAVTDLLGGQIDMMITDTATGLPQVKSGKLRALGVTGLTLSLIHIFFSKSFRCYGNKSPRS